MGRIDEARLLISASPEQVYAAFIDPAALARWLPPDGMSGRVERLDARTGGDYRIVLTYLDTTDAPGKSSADEDVVEGKYVEVTPGVRVVADVEFESDDPAFAGTMRMTWEAIARGTGSEVVFRAEDVPDGISAADHVAGLTSSLRNLAAFVAG
ncbi:SRPBCC domain-containing protein [Microbacterium sp. A93]|uniref:SRPBCC domain-containing protein n=1 Tax=Microbacterium sp. A93 TaxID=3450716 RepID=UPI003F4229DC